MRLRLGYSILLLLWAIPILAHTNPSQPLCETLFDPVFKKWDVAPEDIQFIANRNVLPSALAKALYFIENLPPAFVVELGVTIGFRWQNSLSEFLKPIDPTQKVEDLLPEELDVPEFSARLSQLHLAWDGAQNRMTPAEQAMTLEIFNSQPNLMMLASIMMNLPTPKAYKLPNTLSEVENRIKAFLVKRLSDRPSMKDLLEGSMTCLFAVNRIVKAELAGQSRNIEAVVAALHNTRPKSARDNQFYPLLLREIVDQQLSSISATMAAAPHQSVNLYTLSRKFIASDALKDTIREFEWALALEVGLGVPTYSPQQVRRFMMDAGRDAVKELRDERLQEQRSQPVPTPVIAPARPAQWSFTSLRKRQDSAGIGYRFLKREQPGRVIEAPQPIAPLHPLLPEKFSDLRADQKYSVFYRNPLDPPTTEGVVSFTRQLLRDLPKMTDEQVTPDEWLTLIRMGRARWENDEGVKLLPHPVHGCNVAAKPLSSVMRLYGQKKRNEIVFTRLARGH